jgi:16S rRNA (cytosine1402-N4)-methyltransferase
MSETPPSKPPRRPRYRGSHPRSFREKYKEQDPERYQAEAAKVLASGKTPAGTHRPILVKEVLEVLAPRPGELAVDATLGYGGHARELWRAVQPGGTLFALDVDPLELPRTEARLRRAEFPAASLVVWRSNFAGLAQRLAGAGVPGVDIILADLGLSSMQIDNPQRGFTFKRTGPLDLRMNPERGQPASALLHTLTEERWRRLLEENDEPAAGVLAAALVAAQARAPITTTTGLAEVVRQTLRPQAHAPRSAQEAAEPAIRRVFQALRIEVNDEFSALETFLRYLPACLKPGGRVAILSFHSGEDRRVKKFFAAGEAAGHYSRVADTVVRPSLEETRANPRAASAKLRWALKMSNVQ